MSGPGLVQTRPGRAELVTTAAFRLKDLLAVASRSPRLEICRSRTFICLHIRHTYDIHILYIYIYIHVDRKMYVYER